MLLGTPLRVTEAQKQEARLPYEPVCVQAQIPVCVHPAYGSKITETTAVVNEVGEPLVGIPGGPTQAVQDDNGEIVLKSDGKLVFYLYDARYPSEGELATEMVRALVRNTSSAEGRADGPFANDAQTAVGSWLLEQSGRNPASLDYWTNTSANSEQISGARKDFAELSPDQRETWLRQNYSKLRTGKIMLKDLP